MTEKKENYFLKLLPSIITVAGILVGIWQFSSEQEHRDQDLFRRNIWQKKLELYEKLGNATANIVNSTSDSAQIEKAILDFHNLYWGVLPLIQDDNVEKSIIRFNSEIRYFKRQESSVDELRKRGYHLMVECKTSLNDSWKNLMNDD